MTKKKRKPIIVNIDLSRRDFCPRCHSHLNGITGIDLHDGELAVPEPGCLTLCAECNTPLTFMDNMQLRLATMDEITKMAPEVRAIWSQWVLFGYRGTTH